MDSQDFNPLTPRGVRPPVLCQKSIEKLFQSTHPAGGETGPPDPRDTTRAFQSTHPAGGETRSMTPEGSMLRFQSTHPAGGETEADMDDLITLAISIHSPRGG